MKTGRRRQMVARWLLAVFVPMVLLSSLHLHKEVAATGGECYQCAHHQPHSGHLSAASFAVHDCLLCQMLTVPFVPAAVCVAIVLAVPAFALPAMAGIALQRGVVGSCQGRAPPSVCCFSE